jgi:hypothetical protein
MTLRLERIINCTSRCILTTLLLTSTGPLLFSLAMVVVGDLHALSVAIVRLAADGLPCLSLLTVLYDATITSDALFGLRDSAAGVSEQATLSEENATCLQFLVVIFMVMYALDLLVYASLAIELHQAYRGAAFNLQILLSVVYLIKPWQWARIDLRDIAARIEKFYQLALRVTQGIIQLLDNLPRGRAHLEQLPPELVCPHHNGPPNSTTRRPPSPDMAPGEEVSD